MYQYLNHCRALAIGLFLSWSLVGLSDLGLAQDDFDQYAGHGDVFDQAYDVDGTLIHVSTIWSFQSNSSWLVVKTSPDHGQTWNPIYEGQVQNIDFIKHLSIDVASGFSEPKANHRVYIGVAGIGVSTQQFPQGQPVEVYRSGLVSGSYELPWTSAVLVPTRQWYGEVPWGLLNSSSDPSDSVQGLSTSVAVLPHSMSAPYLVAMASTQAYTASVPYRNVVLSYTADLGRSFTGTSRLVAGEDPCDGDIGALTSFASTYFPIQPDCEGYRHPSLAWDLNNEVLVIAYDGDFGSKGRSIVVGTVDPVRHLTGSAELVGCYNGLISNASSIKRKEQHHPVVASADNLIVFTCLTGKPGPHGSYGMTAFWGGWFYQPWQDAFSEVSDFFWRERGFHDKALSMADLALRGGVMHFTAHCIVDPVPGQPGTAILQFRSEMVAPSESSKTAINDHPTQVGGGAPIIAITQTPSGQRFESVGYPDANRDLWLDE